MIIDFHVHVWEQKMVTAGFKEYLYNFTQLVRPENQDYNYPAEPNKLVRELSGGYQRRVSIATALINEPKILFLDEPTVGIDVNTNQLIMNLLLKRKRYTTIILTTHSLATSKDL